MPFPSKITRSIKGFFRDRARRRDAEKERLILDTTLYNDCVRLPYDLNEAFFTALAEGDSEAVADMLQSNPETALARDYPPPYDSPTVGRMSCYSRTTALDEAVMHMPLTVVDTMLALGANPNMPGKYRFTAMSNAACRGDIAIIDRLIESKGDINAISDTGVTVIDGAFLRGHVAAAAHMIEKGAVMNDPVNAMRRMIIGQYLFYKMHNANILPSLTFLIKQGADINSKDDNGRTVLSLAALENLPPYVFDALLKSGADPNIAGTDGRTPLHIAAERTSSSAYGAIESMCRHGANTLLQDVKGRKASAIAAEAGKGGMPAALADTEKRQLQEAADKAFADAVLRIEHGTEKPVRVPSKIRIGKTG